MQKVHAYAGGTKHNACMNVHLAASTTSYLYFAWGAINCLEISSNLSYALCCAGLPPTQYKSWLSEYVDEYRGPKVRFRRSESGSGSMVA